MSTHLKVEPGQVLTTLDHKNLQILSGIVFVTSFCYDRMHDENSVGKDGFVLAHSLSV